MFFFIRCTLKHNYFASIHFHLNLATARMQMMHLVCAAPSATNLNKRAVEWVVPQSTPKHNFKLHLAQMRSIADGRIGIAWVGHKIHTHFLTVEN